MSTDETPHDLNLLAAHLEDRLDGAEKERLTLHLAGCAECRETLATLARGADLLPRPASAAPASRQGWQVSRVVWLPLAATLVVAFVTLTRLGWWVPADERSRAPVPPSPVLPRQNAGAETPSPAAGTAPRPERRTPPARTGRPSASPAATDKDVLVLRGAQRRVGGKTFRLVFGEWIDADFDSAALLPEVNVSSAEERTALLARLPALAPYAALGERVLVIHEGTVYRFRLEPSP